MQFAATCTCDVQRAAVEFLNHPLTLQGEFQEGCAESAAEVGTALAPVQARAGKTAAKRLCGMEIDAEGFERLLPKCSHVVNVVRAVRRGDGKPAQRVKAVVQGNADGSGHMVVASASGAQIVWCVRNEPRSRNASENTQSF